MDTTIRSQKGGELKLLGRYRYRKARENADGSISWICVKPNCLGRVRTLNQSVKPITDHIHASNPGDNEAAECVTSMRTRVRETIEKPRKIIMDCTDGAEAAVCMLCC